MKSYQYKVTLSALWLLLSLISYSQDIAFEITSPKRGCFPYTLTATNKTKLQEAEKFIWKVNDHTQTEYPLTEGITHIYSSKQDTGKIYITLEGYDKNNNFLGRSLDSIYIWPRPVVHYTVDRDLICKNNSITFTPVIDTAHSSLVKYEWDFGDENNPNDTRNIGNNAVIHTYDFAITSDSSTTVVPKLYVEDEYGCRNEIENQATIPVTIKLINAPRPVIKAKENSIVTCGSLFNDSILYSNHDASIAHFLWIVNGDTLATNEKTINHTFSTNGTANGSSAIGIIATDIAGCTSDLTYQTFQLSNPQPPIFIIDTLTNLPLKENTKACRGTYLISTAPDYSSVEWHFKNTVIAEKDFIASLNYTDSEQIIVTVVNSYNCKGSDTAYIKIEDSLIVEATLNDFWSCSANDVEIILNSNIEGSQYHSIPETTISNDTLRDTVPEGNTVFAIWAISPNGCPSDTIIKEYFVDIPNAKFSFNHTRQTCYPLDVQFKNTTDYYVDTIINGQRIMDSIVKIEWDFNNDDIIDSADISTMDSAYYTYTDTGYYQPRMYVTTLQGCTDTTKGQIWVGDTPTVDIQLIDHIVCASDDAQIKYTTSLGIQYDTLFMFMFQDNHQVTNILAHEKIAMGDIGLFSGWDTVGAWKPMVRASNKGCMIQKMIDDSITVLGPYIDLKNMHLCTDPYNDYTLSFVANYESTEWNWYVENEIVDNTKNLDTLHYIFDTPGNYTVSANAVNDTNKCSYTDSEDVYVRNLNVIYKPLKNYICQYDSLHITGDELKETTTGVDSDTLSFYWHSIAPSGKKEYGSVSGNNAIIFREKGTYDIWVSARDINGCPDSAHATIKSYKPDAKFADNTIQGCSPLTVAIANLTNEENPDTSITSTKWYINNTIAGTDFNLNTTLTGNGPHSVTMEITDKAGCKSTIFADSLLWPIKTPVSIIAPEKICPSPQAVPFIYNGANNIDLKRWTFTDTTIETTKDTIYYNVAQQEGLHPVVFSAITNTPFGQCSSDTSFTMEVFTLAAHIKVFKEIKDCYKATTTFMNSPSYSNDPSIYYEWYLNGNLFDSDSLSNYVTTSFDSIGLYNISLKVIPTKYYGCEALSADTTIYVGSIAPEFVISKDTICVNEDFTATITKDLEPLSAAGFIWTFGDGTGASVSPYTHRFNAIPTPNPAKITLALALDENGKSQAQKYCFDVLEKEIFIHSLDANFWINNNPYLMEAEGCTPFEVTFSDKSVHSSDKGLPANYQWNFGNGQTFDKPNPDTIIYNLPGTYTVSLQVKDENCTDIATKEVTLYPAPIVKPTIDGKVVCQDKSTTISLNAANENITVNWYPLDNLDTTDIFNPIASPDTTTVYTVTVSEQQTAELTCTDSIKIIVRVQQKPVYSGFPNDWIVRLPTKDTLVKLQGNGIYINDSYNVNNDSLPGVTYSWSPNIGLSCTNCASPIISGLQENQIYMLTMVDSNECFIETETIEFILLKDSRIKVTSAFTPNDDGINDLAFARGWGLKEFIWLRIYNRWGQLMYETTDFYQGWDGTYKGIPQNADTYSYIVKAIDHTDKEIIQKGYITLLR